MNRVVQRYYSAPLVLWDFRVLFPQARGKTQDFAEDFDAAERDAGTSRGTSISLRVTKNFAKDFAAAGKTQMDFDAGGRPKVDFKLHGEDAEVPHSCTASRPWPYSCTARFSWAVACYLSARWGSC